MADCIAWQHAIFCVGVGTPILGELGEQEVGDGTIR